ncbi:MAG: HIT family protein [Candidatus Woesearchaeota archaeon]|nr:HIT family protein [Candidatus Woesearchaeota archaeon]MDP7506373.1 HIT family protein [Candidatus Woesearchaeota archaeon]|tara:strand:+ start:572 stop:1093 length:522 start_codon:yes stop_codon:yes gene_type:complete
MPDCQFCKQIKSKENMIYEDDKAAAFLDSSFPGKVTIIPKEHYPIIENVPDFVVGHLFIIANKLSKALFECINSTGTNIIVNNGITAGQTIPHFCINIIPRRENDNINLQWQPKQLSDDEMESAELQLKEETKNIGQFDKEKKEPVKLEKKTEKIEQKDGEENYLVKQLRRIP